MVQRQFQYRYQITQGLTACIQSSVIYIELIDHVHIPHCGSDLFYSVMLIASVHLYFHQPINQQCGKADHEVSYNPLSFAVIYGSGIETCLHDPETVFYLISLVYYSQDVFGRFLQICRNGIISVIFFFFFDFIFVQNVTDFCVSFLPVFGFNGSLQKTPDIIRAFFDFFRVL